MMIGRKQAIAAFFAGVLGSLPWSRRALAVPTLPVQPPTPAPPPVLPSVDAATIDELKKRIAALEAALANQVAFTKDASGNLTLTSTGNVTVHAGLALTLKAASMGTLAATGPLKITGAVINLN